MRDDLCSLDLATLALVTGGTSKKQQAFTVAMNELKSALSFLKEQAAPEKKNDSMLPMVMMMMMRGGGGGGGGGAPAQV